GVRSLAEADETAAGVVTVLGGYGIVKKHTRTGLQGVVGNVIIPGDVGGVGSAATRGQSDAVGLGTAVIPAGKTEVRIRTPGILRRVDAETVRTRCGPGGIVGQGEIYRRIPETVVYGNPNIRFQRIGGHGIDRRAGEIRGQVDGTAVIHHIKGLGIRADPAGQVVGRIDVVVKILACGRRCGQRNRLPDDVVLAGEPGISLRRGRGCDGSGTGRINRVHVGNELNEIRRVNRDCGRGRGLGHHVVAGGDSDGVADGGRIVPASVNVIDATKGLRRGRDIQSVV